MEPPKVKEEFADSAQDKPSPPWRKLELKRAGSAELIGFKGVPEKYRKKAVKAKVDDVFQAAADLLEKHRPQMPEKKSTDEDISAIRMKLVEIDTKMKEDARRTSELECSLQSEAHE